VPARAVLLERRYAVMKNAPAADERGLPPSPGQGLRSLVLAP
jgi:hypothetical protein